MGASAGDNPHPAKAAPPVQRAHKKECPSSAGLGGVIASRLRHWCPTPFGKIGRIAVKLPTEGDRVAAPACGRHIHCS
jgi:hypothetical protein